MKKITFIIVLLLSCIVFGQNSSEKALDDFNEIVNYVPRTFQQDTLYKSKFKFLKNPLNSIVLLQFQYGLKKYIPYTEEDLKWLEQEIEKLTTALFHDGKRYLISQFGGASGFRADKLLDTFQLKNEKIIHLGFFHTCTDSDFDEDFIEIFNAKMYELMQITPPDWKTSLFNGKYQGKGKDRSKLRLEITLDRKFKFWNDQKNTPSVFTEGFWDNNNDTLILNSEKPTSFDTLSNTNWIEFNHMKFVLKRKKLIALENSKWRLKKIAF